MPFTFSHPALVVPLLRLRRHYPGISATGLILGSLAPDFEKFFRLRLASYYSHTIASIFYFSCPVALGLAFIFHLWVRRPLLAHLPAPLFRRLWKYRDFDWPTYWKRHHWGVLLSIIVGSGLHLFWDIFTHDNNSVTSMLPVFSRIITVGQFTMPVHKAVGLISSALGLVALVGWVWQMPATPTRFVPTTTAMGRYWGAIGLLAAVLAGTWIVSMRLHIIGAVIASISAVLVGLIAVSACSSDQPTVHKRS